MPFGPYKNHSHCVRVVSQKRSPPRDPHAYCKWLKRRLESGDASISMFADNEETLLAIYLGETTGFFTPERTQSYIQRVVLDSNSNNMEER